MLVYLLLLAIDFTTLLLISLLSHILLLFLQMYHRKRDGSGYVMP